MLRPRTRSDRRLLLLVPALLAVIASGCGDDDDDADTSNTVMVGIDGTGAGAGTTDADESDDAGQPEDTRDYPSLDEVGRADFMHTIVAGDFLRSIADTYDVEIDDIVGANEWDDGREHLLLPGQEIYLPADAVMPATTEAPEGSDDGAAVPEDASADPSTVCTSGELTDSYAYLDPGDDTIEDVAAKIGVPAGALHRVNDPFPRPPGVPWIVGVPCVDNWPEGVTFWDIIDGPVCPDGSHQGRYEVAQGDTAEAIATRFGVTIEELVAENQVPEDFNTIQAGDTIVVCESWF